MRKGQELKDSSQPCAGGAELSSDLLEERAAKAFSLHGSQIPKDL